MKPQEDLPQILVTPFELMRAASGHPMTVRIQGGQDACLRIPTADEMEAIIREAQAELGGDGPGMPDRERIEDLVRPLAI